MEFAAIISKYRHSLLGLMSTLLDQRLPPRLSSRISTTVKVSAVYPRSLEAEVQNAQWLVQENIR